MLDSNLPIYYFKPPIDKDRYDESVLFTQFDSDPEARYILKHPDRSQEIAKNVYAAAVVDAYIPDIVYGEVLIKPEWTRPTLSAEEIRRNGGVPPPPQPVIPTSFTIQLYNPEQQIVVSEKPASFAGLPSYTFSIPQNTFRQPSASALDRSQDEPVSDLTTPRIHFKWKQEGKFAKDFSCSITGRSTDNSSKKKGGKEPSIMVALFTNNYRDLQFYESNLNRVEMEDTKGLEIAFILSAAVLRDVYWGQQKDCFNTGEAPRKNSSARSTPLLNNFNKSTANLPQAPGTTAPGGRKQSQPEDARAQWELDNETARLKRAHETERRLVEQRRAEQERRDQEEARRLQKTMEEDDRRRRAEAQRRQAEIDRETERLRREFGDQSTLFPPAVPPRQQQRFSAPTLNMPGAYPQSSTARPPPPAPAGPYLQPMQGNRPPAASQSSFFHSSSAATQQAVKPKKSFFRLRSSSNE